jgi:hypothetical protein
MDESREIRNEVPDSDWLALNPIRRTRGELFTEEDEPITLRDVAERCDVTKDKADYHYKIVARRMRDHPEYQPRDNKHPRIIRPVAANATARSIEKNGRAKRSH